MKTSEKYTGMQVQQSAAAASAETAKSWDTALEAVSVQPAVDNP